MDLGRADALPTRRRRIRQRAVRFSRAPLRSCALAILRWAVCVSVASPARLARRDSLAPPAALPRTRPGFRSETSRDVVAHRVEHSRVDGRPRVQLGSRRRREPIEGEKKFAHRFELQNNYGRVTVVVLNTFRHYFDSLAISLEHLGKATFVEHPQGP